MRKWLWSVVMVALVAMGAAWACPGTGCVEVGATSSPPGESWGYVDETPGTGSLGNGVVTSVSKILDDEGEDTGNRLLMLQLEKVNDWEEGLEYSVYVKRYNGSGQLVSTSDPTVVLTTAPESACGEQVPGAGYVDGSGCNRTFFTCFLGQCTCQVKCPGVTQGSYRCIKASSGCFYDIWEAGCFCPYPSVLECPSCGSTNPIDLASIGTSCPAGHTCVVHIAESYWM